MSVRRLLPWAAAVLLLALWAAPLGWMLLASVLPESRLFDPSSEAPWTLTTGHYRAVFVERAFWRPVINSVVVALATTALALVFGTPAAYAAARLRFRGRALVLAAILAVSVFPQIAIVSPLFLVLRAVGLIDTYPGLVLPYLTFSLPLAVWLLGAG